MQLHLHITFCWNKNCTDIPLSFSVLWMIEKEEWPKMETLFLSEFILIILFWKFYHLVEILQLFYQINNNWKFSQEWSYLAAFKVAKFTTLS